MFKPLPKNLIETITALEDLILQSENDLKEFKNVALLENRDKAIIYCLVHAVDLSKGSLCTVKAELTNSLTTLSRAILETLFWARYVAISNDHAQRFIDSTLNELKRVSRKNINAGYLHVFNTITNEDKSEEFLEILRENTSQRTSIETAAKEGGLERVYTTIYGIISMTAHGRAFGLSTKSDEKEELYASICASLGALQSIDVIASDWIKLRVQTPIDILIRILGV